MVVFYANTKKLKEAFKQLKVGLGRLTSKTKYFNVEITVVDGKAILNIPGFQNVVMCRTQGTAKVTVSFLQLFDIVTREKKEELRFEIGENSLKVGITTIHAHSCFFKDDSILRSIRIPINFKDVDFLRLEQQGYTLEEIEFNKLMHLVVAAEENFNRNLNSAYKKLEEYGVTFQELEKMVKEKIYIVENKK